MKDTADEGDNTWVTGDGSKRGGGAGLPAGVVTGAEKDDWGEPVQAPRSKLHPVQAPGPFFACAHPGRFLIFRPAPPPAHAGPAAHPMGP